MRARDLAIVALSGIIVGCVGAATELSPRAAADLNCPPSAMGISHLGAGGYRAIGCGRMATYVCTTGPRGYLCARDSEIEDTRAGQPAAAPRPVAWEDDEPASGRQCRLLCRDLQRCAGQAEISVEYDATATPVQVSHAMGETSESRSCALRVAMAHSLPEGRYHCPSGARSRPVRAGASPRPSAPVHAAAPVAPPAPPAASTSDPRGGASAAAPEAQSDDVEAAARAILNAECSSILACTSTQQAAVRLTPQDDGLRVELQSAADSPESACVRATLEEVPELSSLQLTRPLIHVVRCR